jgi:hypothetical protein
MKKTDWLWCLIVLLLLSTCNDDEGPALFRDNQAIRLLTADSNKTWVLTGLMKDGMRVSSEDCEASQWLVLESKPDTIAFSIYDIPPVCDSTRKDTLVIPADTIIMGEDTVIVPSDTTVFIDTLIGSGLNELLLITGDLNFFLDTMTFFFMTDSTQDTSRRFVETLTSRNMRLIYESLGNDGVTIEIMEEYTALE